MDRETQKDKPKGVFWSSLRFFRTYPVSILPLLAAWCVYATVILYLQFYCPWDSLEMPVVYLIAIGSYILFSLAYGIASLILLEIAQQVETDGKIKFWKAVGDAIQKDFIKALPILLIWAVIWFILSLLQVLFSRRKKNDTNESFSAKAAARTMMGSGSDKSLASSFFGALSKSVRMLSFLILPAIAWEDLSPLSAVKKGIEVFKMSKTQFAKAYVSTSAFAVAVYIVPSMIFYMDSKQSLNLPDVFWYAVLVYIALASSLVFMVEQLYVAQIYLWFMAFKKKYPYMRKSKPLECASEPSFFDDERVLGDKQ